MKGDRVEAMAETGQGVHTFDIVLARGRDTGYQEVATDSRSTDLEADGAWRRIGSRSAFRRLHRTIT